MVTDPLTLLLSEINDTAVTVNYSDGLTAHAFLMNGNTRKAQDADEEAKDHAQEVGFGLGYRADAFACGLDWISSLAEAGDVVDAEFADTLEFESQVPGASLWATATVGSLELLAEYVSATKEYEPVEFSYQGSGAKPAAASLEVKFNLDFSDAWLGVRLDQTRELLFLGAPKSSVSVGYGQSLYKNTSFAIELYSADDYDVEDTASAYSHTLDDAAGSGESAQGMVMQVGVSF